MTRNRTQLHAVDCSTRGQREPRQGDYCLWDPGRLHPRCGSRLPVPTREWATSRSRCAWRSPVGGRPGQSHNDLQESVGVHACISSECACECNVSTRLRAASDVHRNATVSCLAAQGAASADRGRGVCAAGGARVAQQQRNDGGGPGASLGHRQCAHIFWIAWHVWTTAGRNCCCRQR